MSSLAMPSIKNLFIESWDTLKASFGNIFILSLLGSVVGIIFFIIMLISFAGVGFFAAISNGGTDKAQLLQNLESYLTPARIGQISLIFALIVLIGIVISTVARLSIISAIGRSKDKPSIGSCLSHGFATLIPVIIMGIFIWLISFGSAFLFIIPAILIGLFFQFVIYELVLGGKKWLASLSGSVQIMSQHFGEVLLRMLVFFGGYYLVILLPFYLVELILKNASKNDAGSVVVLTMIISLVRFVVNVIAGFYGIVYGVITYQHAKSATDATVKPKLAWIWITSILGWMIAILIGLQIVKIVQSPDFQERIKAFTSQLASQNPASTTSPAQDKIDTWKKAINADARPYYDQSVIFFQEMKAQSSNPAAVKKLNDQNIVVLQKAISLDDSNPELWSDLASAYTWVNNKGTLQDALKASQKAESLDPSSWTYTYGTAEILLSLKRYDEAILKLQQVLRMNDNYARAHIALGQAYLGTGMKESAKTEIQKGIDIFTKYNDKGDYDADILQAQKVLENIK